MFDVYSKFDARDGKLSYNSYIKMGKLASICPQIISTQDYIYIYKTIMRGKKQLDLNVNFDNISDVQGTKLIYADLLEALVKIACLGKNKLNQPANEDRQRLEAKV